MSDNPSEPVAHPLCRTAQVGEVAILGRRAATCRSQEAIR
jgi:hypothetical protein